MIFKIIIPTLRIGNTIVSENKILKKLHFSVILKFLRIFFSETTGLTENRQTALQNVLAPLFDLPNKLCVNYGP